MNGPTIVMTRDQHRLHHQSGDHHRSRAAGIADKEEKKFTDGAHSSIKQRVDERIEEEEEQCQPGLPIGKPQKALDTIRWRRAVPSARRDLSSKKGTEKGL